MRSSHQTVLPGRRAEGLAVGDRLEGDAVPVARLREYGVPPPGLNCSCTNRSILRVLQAEEDQDHRNGDTRVQCSRKHVVVLRPPAEVAPANYVLESESDDCPRYVVDRSRRRDCQIKRP